MSSSLSVARPTAAQLGAWGERHIHRVLSDKGLVLTRPAHGDFAVNGRVIEVKTALPGADGQYRYCLNKTGSFWQYRRASR